MRIPFAERKFARRVGPFAMMVRLFPKHVSDGVMAAFKERPSEFLDGYPASSDRAELRILRC